MDDSICRGNCASMKVLLKVYLLIWICEQPQQKRTISYCAKLNFPYSAFFLQNVTMVGTLLGSFDINKKKSHSVWKSPKKSHATLRAKRATFTFWVDKSSLKMPKIGDFWKHEACSQTVYQTGQNWWTWGFFENLTLFCQTVLPDRSFLKQDQN